MCAVLTRYPCVQQYPFGSKIARTLELIFGGVASVLGRPVGSADNLRRSVAMVAVTVASSAVSLALVAVIVVTA